MLRILVPILAVLLSALPAASQWRQQAIAQLAADAEYLTNRGYRMSDVFTNSLNDGGSRQHEIRLTGGVAYAIVGECDEDCSDLDFELFDAAGNPVDDDLAVDDTPVVQVTPRRTGTFTLRVKMASCSTNPCFYGVGIFNQ
ncbi:MAG TPA: hypothetical protein VFR81_24730 [Longimicrobium sp.]|nr:hypothetical protein [Longimicrobium sp.]